MAVTNTVQGLNCVIDLLKNILDATKSNDDKTVQPRDVSSTSRVTANIQSPEIETKGLSSLTSITNKTVNSAKSYLTVIKTITSKEVIYGIKQMALLKFTGTLKAFNDSMEILVDAINKINNLKVSDNKIKSFISVINSVTKIITSFTDIIFSLGKVMLTAAGLGVLFIASWPLILIGFAGITLTMMGVLAIVKLMTYVQKLLFGGLSPTSGVGKSFKSGIQILLFRQMVDIFLSISALIVIAAGVGLLTTFALPQIFYGFVAITSVIVAIVGIVWFMEWAVRTIFRLNKGPGGGNGPFGFLGAKDKQGLVKIAATVGTVASMVMIMYAISVLVLIAAGVGLLAQQALQQILYGFGAILAVVGGIVLVLWGIKKAVDWIMKDNNSSNNELSKYSNILKAVGSVAALVITMLAISILIIVAAGVGLLAQQALQQILYGFGAMLTTIFMLSLVMFSLNAFVKKIKPTELMKTIGILALICGVMISFSVMFIIIANTAKVIDEAGGWGPISAVLLGIIVVGGLLFAAVFGLAQLCKDPTLTLGLAVAVGVLFSIAAVMIAFAMTIKIIADTMITIGKANKEKAFDGIMLASLKIGMALSGMITALMPASQLAILLMPAFIPLNLLMCTISKFVDIISRVGKDPNFITPVKLDDNGNIISTGEKANIGQIALNIANSFKIFIETLVPAFEDISMRGVRRIGRSAKKINKILNPVSKFADIISKIGNDPNFIAMIDTKELDSNGETKVTKRVKVLEISKNISSAFSTFVSTLALELENIETTNIKKFKKLAKGEGIIGMISGFMEIFTKYRVSDDGKTLYTKDDNGKEIEKTISSVGIAQMIGSLNTEFGKIEYDKIEDFANDFANIDMSSSSIWTILNRVEMFDANSAALEKNAANVKMFQEEWTKLDNIMFKESDKKLKALKDYKKTMEELRDVLREMSESTEKISNMKLPNTNNDNESNKSQQTSNNQTQSSTTNKTNLQNNKMASNTQSQINGTEIADAIKAGLSGSIVKFKFNDSIEDFVGDMLIS